MPCRKCDRAYADFFHLCSIDIVRPFEKRLSHIVILQWKRVRHNKGKKA